jgi:hypothetical protein
MDLFVASVDQEMFSLYQNHEDETVYDVAIATGMGSATWLLWGWDLKLIDYDNDGELDLLLCNGHPDDQNVAQGGSLVRAENLTSNPHDVCRSSIGTALRSRAAKLCRDRAEWRPDENA